MWLRNGAYVVAQVFVVVALMNASSQYGQGLSSGRPYAGLWAFGILLALALIPALIVGVLDGASRCLGDGAWSAIAKVLATVLILGWGLATAYAGFSLIPLVEGCSLFYAYDCHAGPFAYLGVFAGMEASLVIPLVLATAMQRAYEA